MASLVADYGTSSGSESDSEESKPNTQKPTTQNTVGINFLESTADGKDDSDSDDDIHSKSASATQAKSSVIVNKQSLLPNPLAAPSKLPSPSLGADHHPETSVFVTSFHRAAEAKSSILEQHVKMTDTDLPAEVGGKKICWNFRKGKCRFGHKCKYSHGQEILGLGAAKPNGEEGESGSSNTGNQLHQMTPQHGARGYGGVPGSYHGHHSNRSYPTHGNHSYQQAWSHQGESEAPVDEDDYLTNAKNKKKRVGVSDTLVPPKRAMRELDRFRQKERPWTLPK